MKIAEVSKLNSPAEATVVVPGSKSYTLRALFVAALCESEPKLTGLLESKDTSAMRDCLEDIKSGKDRLSAEESGITARFVTALACISPGKQQITGESSLLKRPIGDLVEALRQLGADIEYAEKEGFLPIAVSSDQLSGSEVTISGQTSSQYLSALLLIAPILEKGLEIHIEGKQISKPYIDITLDVMNHFGVKFENDNYKKYTVKPQTYQTNEYKVEGDYSSAAYFYAINALTGSKITVENLNPSSKQGDKKFVGLLNESKLPPRINAEDFPDQAMTLAVLAAFGSDKTTIDGVRSLRVKETERVKAVENELAKMGIKTESTEDQLIIHGGSPGPARIDSYNDHRIAMSFAVAATKIGSVSIFNPEVVGKTFPGFWDELAKVTEVKISDIELQNILLIGMRGSGKTTTARLLAQNLNKEFVELDDLIVEHENKSVSEIVSTKGWEYFRDIESEAVSSIANRRDAIISTGGGVILRDENIVRLKRNSVCVFLRANPEIMERRTANDPNRPALTKEKTLIKEIESIYADRKDKFYRAADFMIDTTKNTPEKVVDEIIDKLGL